MCARQPGYALLLIMFFLALLVLSLAAASPTVLNTIQRERETEMIWRGKQYSRGIRLYYAKMKRLPASLDNLTKPNAAGIRFMRQAYKDPMNQVDGSWRLIYVGPNGQLIGSSNIAGTGSRAAIGSLQASGSSLLSASTSIGRGPLSAGANMSITTPFATSTATTNDSSADDPNQPQSLAGPMDASNTIGGNIIGVGSKVDKKSFMVFHGVQNYRFFEFIFERTAIGVASAGVGTPVQDSSASTAGASTATVPASNAGDWINQMLPGPGTSPQMPPLPKN